VPVTTLMLGGFAFWIHRPTVCEETPECTQALTGLSSSYFVLLAIANCILLLRTVTVHVNLPSTGSQDAGYQMQMRLFLWLLVFMQSVHCFSVVLSSVMPGTGVHVRAERLGVMPYRPVDTLRYVEWLITVPILHIITGKVCLGRRWREVLVTALVNNVYTITSWMALMSTWNRGLLVSLTFLGFGFVCCFQIRWIYKPSHAGDIPLSLGWTALAALMMYQVLYSAIFLLSLMDMTTVQKEQSFYTFMGPVVKICISSWFVENLQCLVENSEGVSIDVEARNWLSSEVFDFNSAGARYRT